MAWNGLAAASQPVGACSIMVPVQPKPGVTPLARINDVPQPKMSACAQPKMSVWCAKVTPASPRAHLPFLTLRFEGGLSFTALPAPTSSCSSSGKGLERSAMMSAMPMAVAATAASGFTFFPFFLRLEGARSLVPCPLPRSSFSTAESSAGSKDRRGVVAAGEPVAEEGGEPAVEGSLVERGVCPVGASTISLMCPNRMRACRGGRSLITAGVPACASSAASVSAASFALRAFSSSVLGGGSVGRCER